MHHLALMQDRLLCFKSSGIVLTCIIFTSAGKNSLPFVDYKQHARLVGVYLQSSPFNEFNLFTN